MKRILAILLTLVPLLGTSTTAIALPEGAVARLGKGRISGNYDRAVQFSPDGKLLAVETAIGVYLYDAQAHDEVAFLETNTQMYSVAFSPDGRILASESGYPDCAIKLWDVSQRKLITTLTGHTRNVSSVAFSPDGSIQASGNKSPVSSSRLVLNLMRMG
jgi:WD40 repeat protein